MNGKLKFITEISVPFLMKGKQVLTINSFGKLHWADKSKVKNEYKDLLKSWFIDDSIRLPKNIHFEWQPIYKDNRKKDAINVAPTIKVVEDIFVESGCLEDDDMTSHHIKVRKTDKSRSNHSLHCRIYERLDD